MAEHRVAIAGAGIAGLTLAAALHRAGIDFDVFEQAPRLSEVGAGVQLAPNATRLLYRLGLADRLSAFAVAPEAIEIRGWDDGALRQRTPLGEECVRRFGAPYYTVHRADLHAALLSLIPPERVHLGAICAEVTQTAGGARLRFAGGATVEARLVVGADGIRSVVREHLAHDRPRYSGQAIYRGLIPSERVPYLLDAPRVRLWFGPGRHCVCYPVSSGRLMNFAATVPAQGWREESWTAPGNVDDLTRAYAGWHEDVTRLLAAAETVSLWALHDRESIDRLNAGRVTVIGDAAHPMLPFRAQGANQAIEDAIALARCLADAGEDLEGALHHYERIRLARTSRIQQESRAGDDSGLSGDWYAWLFGYDAELV